MKKIILTTMVLCSLSITAQEVKFGVKAGANLSALSGDFGNETELKPGLFAGALAEFMINKNMSFQSELLYSQQGVINKKSYLDRDLNYLSLPISYNYYPLEKLKLTGGFQISHLIKGVDKVDGAKLNWGGDFDPSSNKTKQDYDSTKKYSSFSYDALIGASYNVWKGFYLDIRYTLGLNNIIKENETPIFTDIEYMKNKQIELKNRNIQIGVSYKF